ncbi:hypothetical protein BLOT_016716 [Blomia tropicalis]|nr:hypothetical protein BLOT_016716 [Blomia tropicalis]
MDKTLQNTFGQLLFSGAFSEDYLFYAQVGSYLSKAPNKFIQILLNVDIATTKQNDRARDSATKSLIDTHIQYIQYLQGVRCTSANDDA